jgi:hypothetical protein
MKTVALRRAATILAVKGGTLGDITVGDCLELSTAVDGQSARKNRALGFYQLLHSMGVFGSGAPATIRAFSTQGQLSPAQLIDRYGIVCRPVRDVLVATCRNVSRRCITPLCSIWRSASVGCCGGIWNATTPASTRCTFNPRSRPRGSSGC